MYDKEGLDALHRQRDALTATVDFEYTYRDVLVEFEHVSGVGDTAVGYL